MRVTSKIVPQRMFFVSNAGSTRANSGQSLCHCASCNWLLHPALTSAQDEFDPLQLALVVFLLSSLTRKITYTYWPFSQNGEYALRCDFYWPTVILVSSESATYKDEFRETTCVLRFSTLETLAIPQCQWMKALTEVCATSITFPNGVRAFEMAAIKDEGMTQTATNDTHSVILLRTMVTHARLATQRQHETLLQETHFQKLPAL